MHWHLEEPRSGPGGFSPVWVLLSAYGHKRLAGLEGGAGDQRTLLQSPVFNHQGGGGACNAYIKAFSILLKPEVK